MPIRIPAVVALVVTALAPLAAREQSVAQRLVGSWELVSYEIIATDGSTRPGNYDRGQITYDSSGRMSAHLMHSANKADAAPQSDDLRAAAYRRYLGYWDHSSWMRLVWKRVR